MVKIIEFEKVYLEYPEELEKKDEEVKPQDIEENILEENSTTKLSLEELQRRLEETQSLHL